MDVPCVPLIVLLVFTQVSFSSICKESDFQRLLLPCDETRTRSAVYYLKPDTPSCEIKDPPKPIKDIPCECPAGQGFESKQCSLCKAGSYSAGGEIIQDWTDWNSTGIPGMSKNFMITCDFYSSSYRSQSKCAPWTASDDFHSIHSGDNNGVSCIHSSIVTSKNFVGTKNQVQFEYRVDGAKCYSRYSRCDGLGFYVDDNMVMDFVTFKYKWTKAVFNVTKGPHRLRWVFRKKCYGASKYSRAYIKSINLIGIEEPNSSCHPCPVGSIASKEGAEVCEKCPFFKYQNNTGQTLCKSCPNNEYSLPGESKCKPMQNCTEQHLIRSLEPLDKCKKDGSKYTRIRTSGYVIPPGAVKPLCIKNKLLVEKVEVPCECPPGQILKETNGKISCAPCSVGTHSNDSRICKQCQDGNAAVPGKHYYQWEKGTLPEGYASECVGDDCLDKEGWLPAYNEIRTGRILGSIDAFLTSPVYQITSEVGNISYYCSVVCNVSEPLPEKGAHLASVEDCFLQTIIEKDGSFYQSQNCTDPKHRYIYRNQDHRDGEIFQHKYKLPPGNYTFRWHYHQVDSDKSSSAVFGASVFNISVVGVDVGEADSCYTCLPGFYSKGASGECTICPNGTFSQAESSACTPCPDGEFADKPGTPKCSKCGANTKSLKTKDGCDYKNCTFSPREGIEYDLSALSRPGEQMFEYVPLYYRRPYPRPHPHTHRYPYRRVGGGRFSRTTMPWPSYRRQRYYFNFCTRQHDNSSCTKWSQGKRIAIPTMACSSYPWGSDQDIGNVIGFKPNPSNITGGFTIELTNGAVCYSRDGKGTIKTEIKMICDLSAGVGKPDRPSNSTPIRLSSCSYRFRWHSMYGCPKCRPEHLVLTTGSCVDGYMNQSFIKSIPCWGPVEGKPERMSRLACSAGVAAASASSGNKINSLLIGLGVLFVLVLLVIIAYFVHKNRTLKYNYYKMLNKRDTAVMSELEVAVEDDLDFRKGKFM